MKQTEFDRMCEIIAEETGLHKDSLACGDIAQSMLDSDYKLPTNDFQDTTLRETLRSVFGRVA